MKHQTDTIYILDILNTPIESALRSKLNLEATKFIFLTHHTKFAFEQIGLQGPLFSTYGNLESWDKVNGELYSHYIAMFQEGGDGFESLGQFDNWSNFFVGETNATFLMLSALEQVILSEQPNRIEFIFDHHDSIFEKHGKVMTQLANHYHTAVRMSSTGP